MRSEIGKLFMAARQSFKRGEGQNEASVSVGDVMALWFPLYKIQCLMVIIAILLMKKTKVQRS